MSRLLTIFALSFMPITGFAASNSGVNLDLTGHTVGYASLMVFLIAFVLIVLEERLGLHKSKPILFAAGIIWIMIAVVALSQGLEKETGQAIRHFFLEYSELFFFLLVAMTYISAMIERGVFEGLRFYLVSKGYSYRQLFWLTGIIAFFISPIADNLATALIMCTVVLTVGADKPRFVSLSCVGIVVAANAGGAFSPFGDITTLMVWQKGVLDFWTFFKLFIPALVNYLVPALLMYTFVEKSRPEHQEDDTYQIKHGGLVIAGLFILTIVTAIIFHNVLHLPSVIGMLMGLGYLKLFGYYLRRYYRQERADFDQTPGSAGQGSGFDVFSHIASAEWDTLFFFYGVIMSVSGLGYIGYLGLASEFLYGQMGPTTANILVGIISAIVDNIPVMFAVLSMNPDMPEVQWLLVTFTAGVGGSLLSIGSAAGVALMGQARKSYTFVSHLKWTPAIALGYFVSIWVHLQINS